MRIGDKVGLLLLFLTNAAKNSLFSNWIKFLALSIHPNTKGTLRMNVSSGWHFGTTFLLAAGLCVAGLASAPEARADRVANKVAEFSGLDKITGRITTFDVYINETVQFGALQVTPKVCYSRSDNETPRTDSFVQVDEITLNRKIRRIFSGWMFADSPGLNAVDHPVYDIWLKNCKQTSDVPAPKTN